MTKKVDKEIGEAPVRWTGSALYLTMGGGTFKHEGTEGTFAMDAGGSAIIIYVHSDDRASYECRAEDVIRAAVAHHRKRMKKLAKKGRKT